MTLTSIVEYDEERFDQVMRINVKGPFLGLKASIPGSEEKGWRKHNYYLKRCGREERSILLLM